jgi:hypothetical protein
VYLSSSLFYLYPDESVVRSALFHETGHLLFLSLPETVRQEVQRIWETLGHAALLYIFRDGEYSHNARFGGHPYDSPAELFASAFNLFNNSVEELDNRLEYVGDEHSWAIHRLFEIVVMRQ